MFGLISLHWVQACTWAPHPHPRLSVAAGLGKGVPAIIGQGLQSKCCGVALTSEAAYSDICHLPRPHILILMPVYDGGITGRGTITALQTKHYVRRQTKQAGKQAAGRRHLANGLLAADSSGVEPCRAPAARWEKVGFQTVTNGGKAQPAWLR